MGGKLDGLRIAREIARDRGGECLSTEYIGANEKMSWRCGENHEWRAMLYHIKNSKSWCPACANSKKSKKYRLKDGLSIANKIAENKGGACLSNEYISRNIKMKWKCKYNHIWYARLADIKNKNSWCLECSKLSVNRKLKGGLGLAKSIAKNKGGVCLSVEYIRSNAKMEWRCSVGHEWIATFSNVQNGSWCGVCAGKRKHSISDTRKFAEKKGGKCLSNKYENANAKMKWVCSKDHTWSAAFNDIKNKNSWCPECGQLESAKKQNNSCVLYHWKTGEEIVCVASYEKAVVEYLNTNRINFRWQPKTFTTNILTKTGKFSTYRPDLYLYSTRKWIEIKGYMRDDAKEKWNWFQTIKPNSELWNKDKLTAMGII